MSLGNAKLRSEQKEEFGRGGACFWQQHAWGIKEGLSISSRKRGILECTNRI